MVKKRSNEKLISQKLLGELRKDEGYRSVSDKIELSKQIGKEVAQIRKKRKFSPGQLAERIGKATKVIQRIERGEHKLYTIPLLMDLARATNSILEIRFVSNTNRKGGA